VLFVYVVPNALEAVTFVQVWPTPKPDTLAQVPSPRR